MQVQKLRFKRKKVIVYNYSLIITPLSFLLILISGLLESLCTIMYEPKETATPSTTING